ncbi:hypothetical protein BCR22_04390 [Enterococcus plantarum]|uniref:OmpR/PhoB-type domain-containing protein n=1 Tax=Enterococcus haemoperoxidus ATCC BAA-382 TaxID=1158608 RepID=R2T0X6_9ENTE|nr:MULTISPECIES: winged helix-turn-helix domain-containing protein [Enterococcus]EOH98711.1 hypothetical protein UAW_01307 [Enterococcus haemoperoxidus ATCC BAA-382]EOT62106.1 hypothetical protein I583_01106 [Enterococcus haemoperoxidus ATCC BAA-382]OEG12617.1 hypothetical protein BCR22_04390 [Enterococcus plantarum]
MYNLCYIKVATFDLDPYLKALKKECQISEINETLIYSQTNDIDGILIFNEDPAKFSEVCDLILKIKRQINCLIWTISKEKNTISNIVYLQLGVNGNFCEQESIDEYRLIVLNALKNRNYFKKKSEKNSLLVLDKSNREIIIDGNNHVGLTKLEYKLIKLLMENPNRTLTYKELYESIWNKPFKQSTYRVSNLIFHLRSKIETDKMHPKYIKTIRSKGYRFVE